jgi:hypothetical protein
LIEPENETGSVELPSREKKSSVRLSLHYHTPRQGIVKLSQPPFRKSERHVIRSFEHDLVEHSPLEQAQPGHT